ncbi:MAG: DUF3592 domain-containing protein [Hydrogenothermaceae bacterium]|nr:DUF3592 domain-containing protein [Hydrogenothermaceae bacterium]
MINSLSLFIIYTIFASILTIFILYRNFRFFLWKKTEGVILESLPKRVENITRYQTYEPFIEYVYYVNNKEFKSSRVFITDFQSDINTVQKILSEFPKGKKVEIYYNPFNPSESILKKNLHAGMVVQLIALVGIMLPFLFQIFIEILGLGVSKEDLSEMIRDVLHHIFD